MRRQGERGFALLFIFLMGALIAISMYMAMPRTAFESQRAKEQLLVDRGEGYQRAIQLYVRKNKRWPASMDDLEKGVAGRFLRQRYRDPITGKDEWRLIHANGGILTDSKVQQQKDAKKKQEGSTSNFVVSQNFITPQNQGIDPAHPAWDRRRPSEQQGAPGTGTALPVPGQPGTMSGVGVLTDPNNPQPGATGVTGVTGATGQPQMFNPGQIAGVNPIPPGANNGQPGSLPNIPGLPNALRPGQPATPVTNPATAANNNSGSSFVGGGSSFIGGSPAPATATNPNGAVVPTGSGLPGGTNNNSAFGANSPATGTNAAVDAIRNQIMNPQQNPAAQAGMVGAGMVAGQGIAGVASTSEATGIMVRDEQTKYSMWEFIYDPTKEKIPGATAGAVAGNNNTNGQQNGQNGTNNTNTGFGSNTGTASGNSFTGLFGGSSNSSGTTGTGAATGSTTSTTKP